MIVKTLGKELSVIPAVIKRSEDVKALHASQGLDGSVFRFNKLTLSKNSKPVKEFQATVAKAYDTLSKAMPKELVALVGEDQVSTMMSLAKDAVLNNPIPADIQSYAHRQNLTDAGTVLTWVVAKEGKAGAKVNLAIGIPTM